MATKTINTKDVTLYAYGENGELNEVGQAQDVTVSYETQEAAPSRIENLEDAARYAYGVAETRKEIEKIQSVAAKEISKWQEKINEVEAWQAEVLKPLQEKLEYFNMLLTMYHMNEFNNAPNEKAQAKLKSIKLPYGVTLASRELPIKLEVTDDAALLEYAKENGHAEVVEKAKWAEVKKQLKVNSDGKVYDSNGEEVGFVKAVPQERKFEVK